MHTSGFTLLEMLVVLALIGLLAGLVAPDLATMPDRISFAMNREKLEHAIAALPYEAYRQRKDLLVASTKALANSSATPDSEASINIVFDADAGKVDNLMEIPVLAEPVVFDLPKGWSIEVDNPILYRASGVCTGGIVDVRIGAVVYEYEMKAPDCQPIMK